MAATLSLPRWDMTPYFPSLDSDEYRAAFDALNRRLEGLESEFGALPETGDRPREDLFNRLLGDFNRAQDDFRLLYCYVNCFVDTDSRDAMAAARMSELDAPRVRISKLKTRLTAWVGNLDLDRLFSDSATARDHEFALRKMAFAAKRQMSGLEEELAAEMATNASVAWSKLYGQVTSQIEVALSVRGTPTTLPISAVRNLAYDPDASVRESAYRAELDAWRRHATPIAACLNSLKGEFLTLNGRRGWEGPLEYSLFFANIDRPTLDAMMEAAREAMPSFRRYLRAKASRLGYVGALPWHGVFAPVTEGEDAVWDYERARTFILEAFREFSPEMGEFARRTIDERWVDAEPRSGKADGGYCSGTRDGESRIFMNYKPAFGSVGTLAHEIGHAYHNWQLRRRTALQRQTPMTLAETASIFCETLIRRRGLESTEGDERLGILEGSLMGSCQVVVDITSRYLFETGLFAKRAERELGIEELCSLMENAQREAYADGLDPSALHPYMWAAKPHYYSATMAFYNYPYMFGLLFGLGLYALYEREPAGFQERYDELLSSTGLADAATCAEWFGIDIRRPEFWRSSLRVIEDEIDEFVRLAG